MEGHCEYEGIPSIIGKTLGYCNFPIHNARGIGNIIKHLDRELLTLIRFNKPRHIIVSLDLKEALKERLFNSCVELRDHVYQCASEFIISQANGSLTLPESITVVIANKTYDSWVCSDTEGLKNCELIDPNKIVEVFTDVDEEIPNPCSWLMSKTRQDIDIKNRRYRKKLISAIDPNIGLEYSRSLRKFVKEIKSHSI